MEAIKVILSCRSIRKYTAKPVSGEDEALMLKVAMNYLEEKSK